ncbi:DUF21 and CBS domain protein (Mam3), putative [Talaromyces stipitatus ATCC 10500]|uniref:DUF21 and CBS domain protein (Mam3), putative n=1 Tax=Talaromyces stipitatus (strain ATCC 10500 / CBS 375.48 / QM 6759 / NRRL 1006) TaxID=441959 RepID=B8LV63_TALSN|nr:DUF21 and CBS domain protein (Mam3), putative [Talaromyces stipitatus ATCC 10500]EED23113.1 DUF21 and CBS domain protein (Mam3), putative [Talaromyces stipitatus ATCC 10500]
MRSATSMNPYLASRPATLGLAKIFFLLLAQIPALTTAAPTALHGIWAKHDADGKDPEDPELWLYLGISIFLVLAGGAFAGLTIALMGQDEIYLQVIASSGEESERKNAEAVLRLLKRGKHWVLVTLLLSNVITNETLPIVLDRSLGGGWPAVVGSTVLIVIFGEVVPQSICVRYGLPIGAWMAPFVLILMYLMSPVAWPVAKLLDRLLGEDHGTVYKKAGLKTLVTLHKSLGAAGEQLNSDEVTIISACLDLKEKSVGSIMTPMDDVFTMSVDTVLDEEMMDLILSQGYSRIPIHATDNEHNFVGMLLVKMLITYDPEDCKQVRDFALATLPETRPETSCLDIVNFFQEGKSHMVLVSDYPGEDHGALGVVTLEDVIEELIGEEIIDESDVFIDVHKAIRRLAPAPKARVPKGRIVEEPPSLPNTTVDDHNANLDLSKVQSAGSEPRRLSSTVVQPLGPKFTLRNNFGAPEQLVVKRGTDEIREHLKHLGPSNLASRPRQTRYQTVKIKAPGTSPTRSGLTDSESGRLMGEQLRRPSEVASNGSGIGSKLLGSPSFKAKDGVHAVQQGYGTIDGGVATVISPLDDDQKTHIKDAIPESQYERDNRTPKYSPPRTPNRSKPSSLHSDEARRSGAFKPGPARSGSITEQVVDLNGVRKVVLQTTSSSSSGDEQSTSNGKTSPTSQQHHHHHYRHQETTELSYEQAIDSDQDGGAASTTKKKRRRRKKKRQGDDPENAPLLPP